MSAFSFSPVISINLLLPGIGVLTALFIYLEIKRKTKYLLLRISAVLIMMLSILFLTLQPSITHSNSLHYILLTQGYEKTKVDSLLEINNNLSILHCKDVPSYRNSSLLNDNDLPEQSSRIQYILGTGIPIPALELLKNKNITFLPSTPSAGVYELLVPQEVNVNEIALMKGKIQSSEGTLLRLLGPGGVEDSVHISPKELKDFSLAFKPKSEGNFLYTLEWTSNKKVEQGKIPIHVYPEKKLSILFLQQAPGIEMRQLKNYLADAGHAIRVRSQISQEKYRYEYINTAPSSLSMIRAKTLDGLDLLVLENSTFSSLSLQEVEAIETAVEHGLGVLLLLNSEPDKKELLSRFLATSSHEQDTLSLVFDNKKKVRMNLGPCRVNTQRFLTSYGEENGILYSGMIARGFGKVGFQRLQETYRLFFAGETDSYAQIWNSLIKRVSRNKELLSKMEVVNDFPIYSNERIHINVVSEEVPLVMARDTSLPLSEDVVVDNLWHAFTWPDSTGWHTVQNKNDSTQASFYVFETREWESLRISKQVKSLQRLLTATSNDTSERVVAKAQKEINRWIFFFTFLFSAGFLWLAPKL